MKRDGIWTPSLSRAGNKDLGQWAKDAPPRVRALSNWHPCKMRSLYERFSHRSWPQRTENARVEEGLMGWELGVGDGGPGSAFRRGALLINIKGTRAENGGLGTAI